MQKQKPILTEIIKEGYKKTKLKYSGLQVWENPKTKHKLVYNVLSDCVIREYDKDHIYLPQNQTHREWYRYLDGGKYI